MKKLMTLSAVFCAAALTSTAFADDMSAMKMTAGTMGGTPAAASAANTALTDAVVKQIDPSTGMVTLRHGALSNVGMPPMTMAFKAKDAAMLTSIKEGDKVKVRVENVGGTLTIVNLAKQ